MPSPNEMLLRTAPSPVPTYTTSGLSGCTAIAPIDRVLPDSKTGANVVPPFVDLYSPEDAAPTYRMSGLPGTPATSATRPANMAGPIARQVSPSDTLLLDGCCTAAEGALDTASAAATKKQRYLIGVAPRFRGLWTAM